MIEPTMLGDCKVLPESIQLTNEVQLLMDLITLTSAVFISTADR